MAYRKQAFKNLPKSKYHNVKVTVDGREFGSKKEAERYLVLKQEERAGKIQDLKCQEKWVLSPPVREDPDRKRSKVILQEASYIADFQYYRDGKLVVEDVKGYRGGGAYALFVLKKKWMYQKYGVLIREV